MYTVSLHKLANNNNNNKDYIHILCFFLHTQVTVLIYFNGHSSASSKISEEIQ